MTAPARLVVKPSPVWAAVIVAVHLGAILSAWMGLPPVAAVLVSLGLAVSGWHGASVALVRGPHAVRELELKPDGRLALADTDGVWHDANVSAAGLLGSRLAAMVAVTDAGRHAVVVVPGVMDPHAFRQLRVWLRWRPDPVSSPSTVE